MRIWAKYFLIFTKIFHIWVYPCLNVIFLEILVVLYILSVVLSYTQQDTYLLLWAFFKTPLFIVILYILNPFESLCNNFLLSLWQIMYQVLNPKCYIYLISLNFGRILSSWYDLKLCLKLLFEFNNILNLRLDIIKIWL